MTRQSRGGVSCQGNAVTSRPASVAIGTVSPPRSGSTSAGPSVAEARVDSSPGAGARWPEGAASDSNGRPPVPDEDDSPGGIASGKGTGAAAVKSVSTASVVSSSSSSGFDEGGGGRTLGSFTSIGGAGGSAAPNGNGVSTVGSSSPLPIPRRDRGSMGMGGGTRGSLSVSKGRAGSARASVRSVVPLDPVSGAAGRIARFECPRREAGSR